MRYKRPLRAIRNFWRSMFWFDLFLKIISDKKLPRVEKFVFGMGCLFEMNAVLFILLLFASATGIIPLTLIAFVGYSFVITFAIAGFSAAALFIYYHNRSDSDIPIVL